MATRTKRPSSKLEKAEKRVTEVYEDFEWLKILIYGKAKRGKTTLGSTGPKPVIIDCNERGTLSVRRHPDCKVFHVNVWSDIDLAYWWCHRADHDRETVVIDTLTSLQNLAMKFVLGDLESRDPTREPDTPDRRMWGQVGELMKNMIIQFRNLPMNVVFLAQEKRGFKEDDDEDDPEVYPQVSPSIRDTLTPAVDMIGRLYVKEVVTKQGGKERTVWERRLLIGDHETYITGDRSNAGFPRIIRNPNLSEMLAKIHGLEE